MDKLANSVLEYPEQLSWIDFSFNFIVEIDEVSKILVCFVLILISRTNKKKF